jgi:hypothetical protein
VGFGSFSRIIQSVYFWNYYVILCILFNCIEYNLILFIVSVEYDTCKLAREKKKNFFFHFYLPRRPKGAGCRPFPPHVHHSNLYRVDNPEMGH